MKEAENNVMIIMAAENFMLFHIDTFIKGLRAVLFSRYHCHRTKSAISTMEMTMSTGTHGVLQPTTLPSVRANIRASKPIVISVPPIQSTAAFTLVVELLWIEGTGIMK